MVLQEELLWILGNTLGNNDLLTTFVTGNVAYQNTLTLFHQRCRHWVNCTKTLDDLFSNCLISISVRELNVSLIDMHASITSVASYEKVLESKALHIFNIV